MEMQLSNTNAHTILALTLMFTVNVLLFSILFSLSLSTSTSSLSHSISFVKTNRCSSVILKCLVQPKPQDQKQQQQQTEIYNFKWIIGNESLYAQFSRRITFYRILNVHRFEHCKIINSFGYVRRKKKQLTVQFSKAKKKYVRFFFSSCGICAEI